MAKNLIEKFIKVEWIIEEKKFYKSIFENFDSNILSENSIEKKIFYKVNI